MSEAQEILARFAQEERELKPEPPSFVLCYQCDKEIYEGDKKWQLQYLAGMRTVCDECYNVKQQESKIYYQEITEAIKTLTKSHVPF